MNLWRKLTLGLRVASMLALAVALVPLFAGPARATGGTIDQLAPFDNTTSPTASSTFNDQLVTDGSGTVTFSQSTGAPDLTVSSSGAITATALSDGTYIATGTDADTDSDTGSWTYTLDVTDNPIVQSSPIADSTTPPASADFTDQLEPTTDSGTVTYSLTSTPDDLAVSDTGEVTTTGTLAVGTYTASGTDTDGTDSGIWSYSLTVNPGTISQGAPFANGTTVTPAQSGTFTDSLATTGGTGTILYDQTSPTTDLTVSASGAISVTGGATLPVGPYTATGTDSDAYGDTGSWTYTLTVSAGAISQSLPQSNAETVTPATSSGFTDQLDVSGVLGSVTYTQSTGATSLTVSDSGAVSVTGGTTLAVGSYTATGTDSDTEGDTGTWTYTLTITPAAIAQSSPTSNGITVTPATSAHFSDQLNTTGNQGAVIFTLGTSTYPPGAKTFMEVSTSGAVTTTGELEVGTYTATGTATDSFGDTPGSWTYTLTVASAGVAQSPPEVNASKVTPASSTSFSAQLEPTSSQGPVSFTWDHETNPNGSSAKILASSTGVVAATGRLETGTYTLSGTDADAYGDSGTFAYTLHVSPGPIGQTAPTLNSTTPAHSSVFTQQLATSENLGPVSFVTTSRSGPSGASATIRVSSTGIVSTTGALVAGTFKASGTDSDRYGDLGSWSFTLKVSATAITQAKPFKNTGLVTTAGSARFTSQLKVSGGDGPVSFVTTSKSAPRGAKTAIRVSSRGAISTTGALIAGTYSASGTDSDTHRDNGTWSFSLTVTGSKVSQLAPAGASTTTGTAFTGKLKVSGAHGAVRYKQSRGAPQLKVSSSGVVAASANLAAGTYKAAGTDSDSLGDTGTWSFSLTVHATLITQIAPASGSIRAGGIFSGQLKITGSHGSVTFSQLKGAPDLKVSPSGRITTLAGLAKGNYAASGTDTDSLGDTGTWRFVLTVTGHLLSQLTPVGAATTTGRAFREHLRVSGASGEVTYTQSKGAPYLTVSSSGLISAPPTLPAGTYQAMGTTRDFEDDTGTWSFTLTVNSTRLVQDPPSTASTAAHGTAFTAQLKVSGAHGTVTYSQSSGAPQLRISSSGAISATAGLAKGSYRATGTMRDALGDKGAWSFTLTVAASKLTELGPTKATTKSGKAFKGQLKVSGAHGAVTFTQKTGAPHVKVSSSGVVTAPASLKKGTYKASGTEKDAAGDVGTWTFTLTVKASSSSPPATKLVQIAPTAGRVTSGIAFKAQLRASGGKGSVVFTQSTGSPSITVSSSGLLTAPNTLAAATYQATGTMKDSSGATAKWTFTLFVVPA